MASLSEKSEILLYNYFQSVIEHIQAVFIFDRNGLMIAKRTIEMEATDETEDLIYGAIAGIVEPTLNRITSEYAGSFGTGTFETGDHRLNFIEAGTHAIVLSVFGFETNLSRVMPYSYLIAEKVARLMDDPSADLDLSVPNLKLGSELELDSNLTQGPILNFNVDGSQRHQEMVFKLCVIGEPSVGKTSLIHQFVNNEFLDFYKPTLGISITSQTYEIQGFDQNKLNFMVWDVAGQKFFQRVRKYYYMGANAAFIVYDTTRRETFDKIKYWFDDIHDVIPHIPLVVIGNKIDLDENRAVSYQEGEALAKELGCSYMETSAKSGQNVRDAFSIVGIGLFFKLNKKAGAEEGQSD
jgi:small GTP-binding protein